MKIEIGTKKVQVGGMIGYVGIVFVDGVEKFRTERYEYDDQAWLAALDEKHKLEAEMNIMLETLRCVGTDGWRGSVR